MRAVAEEEARVVIVPGRAGPRPVHIFVVEILEPEVMRIGANHDGVVRRRFQPKILDLNVARTRRHRDVARDARSSGDEGGVTVLAHDRDVARPRRARLGNREGGIAAGHDPDLGARDCGRDRCRNGREAWRVTATCPVRYADPRLADRERRATEGRDRTGARIGPRHTVRI